MNVINGSMYHKFVFDVFRIFISVFSPANHKIVKKVHLF